MLEFSFRISAHYTKTKKGLDVSPLLHAMRNLYISDVTFPLTVERFMWKSVTKKTKKATVSAAMSPDIREGSFSCTSGEAQRGESDSVHVTEEILLEFCYGQSMCRGSDSECYSMNATHGSRLYPRRNGT